MILRQHFLAPLALSFALSGGPAFADRSDPDFAARLLTAHNAARADVGLPPLSWSEPLAEEATIWAGRLVYMPKLEHSPPAMRPGQGENLWMGTAGRFSLEHMVEGWTKERRFLLKGPLPNVSLTGHLGDVGHYTQIVWRSTREVGCGLLSSPQLDFLVCRYSPQGNIIGQSPY